MEFRKYNSIENSYRKKTIEYIRELNLDKGTFVVQEKIHGANLSFWTDGKDIRCAKRGGFVEPGEQFYTAETVMEKNRGSILKAFALLKETYPQLKYIALFGELFGGGYPHDSVERDKTAVAIQKGIYYCPANEFCVFDIRLDSNDYLSVSEANSIFEKAGFIFAETLFIGSFDEAMNYSNSFKTRLPGKFGLPEIEPNICEGVVIRPEQPVFFPDGSRFILKNKNEKWAENTRKNKLQLDQDKISDLAIRLSEVAKDYINENRLNNVVSKLGEVTNKDIGKIIGLLSTDAIEDFDKDYSEEFDSLEKKEQKLVKKSFAKAASQLVRQEL